MAHMTDNGPIGVAAASPVQAFFVPAGPEVLSVWPPTPHARRAAAWALRTLGYDHLGGLVCLIAPSPDARAECLATALAVADAAAGGHRPPGPLPDLAVRLRADPVHLCGLRAAAGLD
ncbi:hypothetical protein [Lentzea albidocapillata]|uniref:Uncharacterized protein n=1 Tax=Lentzea albidocapillata TaxID=40571 RepID=A0A1W1ZJQ0_9PSEU|nr:hypothetical protein [Lentzea albidocapillata]SMC48626.1 hypothetical protein SAMN05660733_00047 [Lentzea albidocapillata]